MSGSLTIDDTLLKERLSALAALLPAAAREEVLRIEAKEFVRRVISFLPPKNKSQGTKAVARDIGRAIRVLDARTIRDKEFKKAILSGDVAAIEKFTRQIPELASLVVSLFDPRLHTERRNRRGHISASTKPTLVPQPDVVKNYTKKVQDRVGLLKAGYAAAADQLGHNLPQWVRRHGAGQWGHIQVTAGNADKQAITITHRSGKWPDHARVARSALEFRREALKSKLELLIAGRWVNLGGKLGRTKL